MDLDWLKEAYRRTRKDGAVGVDGVTADEYEQELEGNLQNLIDRVKSGTYRATPGATRSHGRNSARSSAPSMRARLVAAVTGRES